MNCIPTHTVVPLHASGMTGSRDANKSPRHRCPTDRTFPNMKLSQKEAEKQQKDKQREKLAYPGWDLLFCDIVMIKKRKTLSSLTAMSIPHTSSELLSLGHLPFLPNTNTEQDSWSVLNAVTTRKRAKRAIWLTGPPKSHGVARCEDFQRKICWADKKRTWCDWDHDDAENWWCHCGWK